MKPARTPPPRRDRVRLLAVDPGAGRSADLPFGHLAELLDPGDLLVVNDAATLPASLSGVTAAGAPVELRLVAPAGALDQEREWQAAALGAGDWRTPTEHRPLPPPLPAGTRLRFGALGAEVLGHADISPRLVHVRFDPAGAALWQALYAAGKPIQYAHLDDELALWSVQTLFAARPWAVEMPSAGRAITGAALGALRGRGVEVARLTHAAGLSATGDPAIDRALPLPERYEIPAPTARAVDRARARGGRIIAAGTTVVRALEGCAAAHGGRVQGGSGVTELVISPGFVPAVVDGLLTGMHEPESSHFRLLQAFASPALLAGAWDRATRLGYRGHELGDTCLIAPGVLASRPARPAAEHITAGRAAA